MKNTDVCNSFLLLLLLMLDKERYMPLRQMKQRAQSSCLSNGTMRTAAQQWLTRCCKALCCTIGTGRSVRGSSGLLI